MALSTKICNNFIDDLEQAVGQQPSEDIFILTDENTRKLCLPIVIQSGKLANSHHISIASGDENKNINSAIQVWQYLSENGATRKSLLINVGGGMITDIGGFVASTFKRGIRYINVSTTLLGAVDAATGGKTGINFLGLKNEIGVFCPPAAVLINTDFLKTLDDLNLRSGYAEMLKHALIDSREEWNKVSAFDLDNVNFETLKLLISNSIRIKEMIVEQDPFEKNVRKALNLGHTFGHAFESWSYEAKKPILHGYAIAWGLICELYLSHIRYHFPKDDLLKLKYLIKEYYGTLEFSCKQYDTLYKWMTHDKKNDSVEINFTLLAAVGNIKINQHTSKKEIFECFDFLREI